MLIGNTDTGLQGPENPIRQPPPPPAQSVSAVTVLPQGAGALGNGMEILEVSL